MKKYLILFLIFNTISNIQAQVASSCIAPQLFTEKYSRDIAQLALKRLYEHKSPDTAYVRIPQKHIDSISQGMAAIFNATSIPQRDTIFNMYCVHNINGWPYGYEGYMVQVDTSYAWTRAWQNKQTITGNSQLDIFTSKYDLQVTEFHNYITGNFALLSTESSWNPLALIDSLKKIAGVSSAEINSIYGGFGKITYKVIGNVKYYDFYYQFGDCFAGCTAYRMWKFKVNPDCSVNYLGFEDHGMEPFAAETPINCNAFASVTEKNRTIKYPIPKPCYGCYKHKKRGYIWRFKLCLNRSAGQICFNRRPDSGNNESGYPSINKWGLLSSNWQ